MAGIIGMNLTYFRTKAKMSQAQLGEVMGVHQSTVAYWENISSWSPTPDDMSLLCSIFRVSPGDFYLKDASRWEKKPQVFGENLCRLRLAQSMSRLELGKKMGVHPATIKRWEKSPFWIPTPDDMRKLRRIFRVGRAEFSRKIEQEAIDVTT